MQVSVDRLSRGVIHDSDYLMIGMTFGIRQAEGSKGPWTFWTIAGQRPKWFLLF
ncbi:MAG: hypothetical protein ABI923_02995 [bacterium]